MTDDELDEFYINSDSGKKKIYENAKTEFDKFSPAAKGRTIDALEFIIASKAWDEHWRKIIPHEIPLDDVIDKESYVRDLFFALSNRMPNQNFRVGNVYLNDEIGPDGIQFYE